VHAKPIVISLALFASLALACRGRAPRLRPTDEYLTTYLTDVHDWMDMTNRHVAESEALIQKISARYPPSDPGGSAHDPEFLALLNRQREEMAPVVARLPNDSMGRAVGAAIAGIGRVVIGDQGMTFVVQPNDSALRAARAQYGDKLVDWVLARKGKVIEVLSQ
jgi:hypothetical protein